MNWYKLAQNLDTPNDEQKEPSELINWKDKDEMWEDVHSFHPNKNIPYLFNEGLSDDQYVRAYNDMKAFRENFSYAIPSREAIQELVQWLGGSKVIEIGAGRGLWARLLSEEGIAVEASDLSQLSKNKFFSPRESGAGQHGSRSKNHVFFDVKQMSGDDHARQSTTNDTLMMVWPYFSENDDDGEDWQSNALRSFNGSKFIFVGETAGGTTGSPALWREISKNWRHDGSIDIPRWQMIHDHIQLYVRK
jgi:hypothetical protein